MRVFIDKHQLQWHVFITAPSSFINLLRGTRPSEFLEILNSWSIPWRLSPITFPDVYHRSHSLTFIIDHIPLRLSPITFPYVCHRSQSLTFIIDHIPLRLSPITFPTIYDRSHSLTFITDHIPWRLSPITYPAIYDRSQSLTFITDHIPWRLSPITFFSHLYLTSVRMFFFRPTVVFVGCFPWQ